MSGYRCEATTVAGFLQQLAVSYVGHGYWFYVTGEIPAGKDPRAVDEKLLAKYGLGISKWARARRKKAGRANAHYLRHERFFVLCASKGEHPFFAGETAIRDFRETPLRFHGHSVSAQRGSDGRWHPSVRIEAETLRAVRARLVDLALRRSADVVAGELSRLPFEPYAPVRQQYLALWRAVNRARKPQGLPAVPIECLRLWRAPRSPFAEAA